MLLAGRANVSDVGSAYLDWLARDRLVSFEAVVEQPFVVEKLSKAVTTKGPGAPTILHGVSGVGKTSIAFLYAQAMTCQNPTPSGSPCWSCPDCETALAGEGQLSCQFVNAAGETFGPDVDAIVADASSPTLLGERRVTIVFNAERGDPAVFDRFLKALERITKETFVFVAEDITKLPAALKSRCERLIVRPLSPASACERLETICKREGVTYNEDALSVIAAQSRRRAGKLLRSIWQVSHDGDVTLERTRDRLGLNWPDLGRLFMMESIDDNPSKATATLCALGRDVAQATDRICRYQQQLSLQLQPEMLATSIAVADPAFMHRTGTDDAEVIRALGARAVKLGISPAEFVGSIARFWSACEATERIGLQQYVRRFCRLLALGLTDGT